MKKFQLPSFLIGLGIGILILVSATGGAIADRLFDIRPLDFLATRVGQKVGEESGILQRVLNEESAVIDVAEAVSPSVVTISIEQPERRVLQLNPNGRGFSSRTQGGEPQDIGSGFIVSSDGLIVTNKHVVSDTDAFYKVITSDDKEYEVVKISRDPSNDLAVIKIDPPADGALQPVELGSSDNLKVGQFVIAIGTALGEFRHTVTTGVVSGLGRGITAGSSFEGFVERLDDVIQTDAAINPGNSGGPLLNYAGQVVGVNVAVASGAENIGFAIPIDLVRDALNQFNETGSFASKPFLGVNYQMVDEETAILNKVVQGAYIIDVVEGAPAEISGVQVGDIITKMDGEDLTMDNPLANVISKKKAGDNVSLEVWREGETVQLSATLSEFSE